MKKLVILLACLTFALPIMAQEKTPKGIPAAMIVEYVTPNGAKDGKMGDWEIFFTRIATKETSLDFNAYAISALLRTSPQSVMLAGYAMQVSSKSSSWNHAEVSIVVDGPKVAIVNPEELKKKNK
jgi:hypothetical protein